MFAKQVACHTTAIDSTLTYMSSSFDQLKIQFHFPAPGDQLTWNELICLASYVRMHWSLRPHSTFEFPFYAVPLCYPWAGACAGHLHYSKNKIRAYTMGVV